MNHPSQATAAIPFSTLIYKDLARAKSEALVNIYRLVKQNIKSRQRKTAKKIISRSNEKKKKNNNDFAGAAHFFVQFFAVVLHDYNLKLPETS